MLRACAIQAKQKCIMHMPKFSAPGPGLRKRIEEIQDMACTFGRVHGATLTFKWFFTVVKLLSACSALIFSLRHLVHACVYVHGFDQLKVETELDSQFVNYFKCILFFDLA